MLNIDHAHSHAIITEIGERLRATRHETELPTSFWRHLDRLRELDEDSPSIVPPMDAATRW